MIFCAGPVGVLKAEFGGGVVGEVGSFVDVAGVVRGGCDARFGA